MENQRLSDTPEVLKADRAFSLQYQARPLIMAQFIDES